MSFKKTTVDILFLLTVSDVKGTNRGLPFPLTPQVSIQPDYTPGIHCGQTTTLVPNPTPGTFILPPYVPEEIFDLELHEALNFIFEVAEDLDQYIRALDNIFAQLTNVLHNHNNLGCGDWHHIENYFDYPDRHRLFCGLFVAKEFEVCITYLDYTDQMPRYAKSSELFEWLIKVSKANTSYYKVRKELFDDWNKIVKLTRKEVGLKETINVSSSTFNSIWQYLTTRNEHVSNELRLSFQAAIENLILIAEVEYEKDNQHREVHSDVEEQENVLPKDDMRSLPSSPKLED